MNTDTTDSPNTQGDRDLSPTTIFSLLADDRRRLALHYLVQRVGAVHIGEVAEQIALWEGEPTRERYERILTGLNHSHVPKLNEAGVVRFDVDRDMIERLPAADALIPYLDRSVSIDIS